MSYSSQSDLDALEKWDSAKDMKGLLNHINDMWEYPNYYKLSGKRVLRLELHTGGWSGNEDIIDALSKNFIFWSCWEKSIRGGHYYFKIPKFYLKGETPLEFQERTKS